MNTDILVIKREWKSELERPKRRWDGNVMLVFKK